ncbi:serine/threonine-protein kinase [Microbacterium sp. UBA837]|uniref:serine/threonine-protein kinase n=1 Tax=Microbacterium sp. UBA837 TaxID=1946956 RepID=UPI0025D43E29|nr:serine/threonine-protein kinase [Microbacterium sp. UBA837]|tara:strand:- start:5912 stop:7492 length:1581 start_codon:yes stop_codon:yes gene_type:complete
MASRPPSQPPALPGFEYVRLLGSGGFADVFLYQQLHPRRQVAVKVLLKDRLGTTSAEGFTEEANLMAQLANHPSIVSVYQAGVSGDGRPYLVMEFCSKPNLQARHRRERFSEAETLRVGIQIAGAVETAHRAGILHRDIKPANILVTDFGRPALTDFGISATTSDALSGMSIPWSPPESLRMPPEGYPSSDVYSLAATLYTLLTNRSPFEIPGASNTELDVMARIQSMPLPRTGRADVSEQLQNVLARAMAKDARERYSSAIEFARALQRVQIEHGMQATQIDVIEDELLEDDDADGEERTRFRGVTSIDAQASVATAPPRGAASGPSALAPSPPPVLDATVTRQPAASAGELRTQPGAPVVPSAPPLNETIVRPAAPVEADPDTAVVPRKGRWGWVIGVGAGLIVAAGVALVLVWGAPDSPAPADAPSTPVPVDAVDETAAPVVEDLTGAATETGVSFTWTNPDPEPGDVYLWRPITVGEDVPFEETTEPSIITAPDPSGRTCIEVVLRRANGVSAQDPVQGCVP